MTINKNQTYIEINKKKQEWYIVDAEDQTLGRLSSKVAFIIKGKNKSTYLPYINNHINIIIINSQLIKVTGKKREQKLYKKHSGKPGGLKIETFNKLNKRIPNKIIETSIKGMLPKNSLGRKLFKQIKIYSNDKHPHNPQKPVMITSN
uniref:Large ribosomal subunit protein uL13c n=1 Tax=Thuretia quercifolia TaxID=189650 RepID=A0A1Z1ML53_9FLOR|nr:ribosomal protein L13 [Thuretia quercifolia]ARW66481.1 ribosomal protein L13 [Thuretia quercifolia]